MERRGSKSRLQAGSKRYEIVIKNKSFWWFPNRKECGYTYGMRLNGLHITRGKKMTTATNEITLETMATELCVTIDEVAIRKAGSLSRHLVLKGTAFCGRINNDGYNLTSEYEYFNSKHICVTCLKRYNSKVAKVNA
jgi:hypothetical protein